MRYRFRTLLPGQFGLLALFVVITAASVALAFAILAIHFLSPACAQERGGLPVTSVRVAKDYLSPQAVFSSYREARNKGDWRHCFRCLTLDAQRSTLFELYFECAESGSAEARQIMATHIGDPDKFRDEYKKHYKAKHGVEGSIATATPDDTELFMEVLFSQIQDKAGCYAAVTSFFLRNDRPSLMGELEGVAVEGDKATGRAKVGVKSDLSDNGKLIRKNEDLVDGTFEFRKINGEWLIATP